MISVAPASAHAFTPASIDGSDSSMCAWRTITDGPAMRWTSAAMQWSISLASSRREPWSMSRMARMGVQRGGSSARRRPEIYGAARAMWPSGITALNAMAPPFVPALPLLHRGRRDRVAEHVQRQFHLPERCRHLHSLHRRSHALEHFPRDRDAFGDAG